MSDNLHCERKKSYLMVRTDAVGNSREPLACPDKLRLAADRQKLPDGKRLRSV
jgi:hypothetical protein